VQPVARLNNEAIRMLEQNGGTSPVIAGSAAPAPT
jgi:hypothetical protein